MEPITTSSSVLAGVASANRATVILATGADLRANVLENDSMRDIIVLVYERWLLCNFCGIFSESYISKIFINSFLLYYCTTSSECRRLLPAHQCPHSAIANHTNKKRRRFQLICRIRFYGFTNSITRMLTELVGKVQIWVNVHQPIFLFPMDSSLQALLLINSWLNIRCRLGLPTLPLHATCF